MIIGIGNDIIEVERVGKACSRSLFLTRYFTNREVEQCGKKVQSLAGNFCVKECVVKALGTGFRGISPIDIEVLREVSGKPYVVLYGQAKKKAEELKVQTIHVSISNLKELAQAFVVLES